MQRKSPVSSAQVSRGRTVLTINAFYFGNFLDLTRTKTLANLSDIEVKFSIFLDSTLVGDVENYTGTINKRGHYLILKENSTSHAHNNCCSDFSLNSQ